MTMTDKKRCAHWILFLLFVFFVGTPDLLHATQPSNRFKLTSNDDCLVCHSDESLSMEKNGKPLSLYVDEKVLGVSPHKKLECISCHDGFNPEDLPHKEDIKPIDCMTCHKDAKIKHLFHPQIFQSNSNSTGKDVNCKSCHGTHDAKPYKNIARSSSILVCAKCHVPQNNEYNAGIHSYGLGAHEKPSCINCHSAQITKGSFGSDKVRLKTAQQELCLNCHIDTPENKARFTVNKGFIPEPTKNTHSKLIASGNGEAAGCVDCHGSHKISKTDDSTSTVVAGNILNTCGRCHADQKKEYEGSVHFDAFAKKIKDAPVCSNCHNEHQPLDVATAKVCGTCHEPVELSTEYALSNNKTKVFKNTYHGLTVKGDVVTVSNCNSCHGSHAIVDSEKPASSVNKKNLQATCGKCHPGAEADFASGNIHKTPGKVKKPEVKRTEEPGTSWSGTFLMIGLVVAGVALLIGLVKIIRKKKSV